MRPFGSARVCGGDNAAGDRSAGVVTVEETTMSSTRIQLALNVSDVAAATEFYTKLFGVAPHKRRDGYANFVVADPPLKLVLIENPDAPETLNHLGVEAPTPEQVNDTLTRVRSAGLSATVAESDLCCHAVQDKVFVAAPDVPHGWWEFYAVTDDNPANPERLSTSACAVACATENSPTDRSPAASVCCG